MVFGQLIVFLNYPSLPQTIGVIKIITKIFIYSLGANFVGFGQNKNKIKKIKLNKSILANRIFPGKY
jgi:hypothetical protein